MIAIFSHQQPILTIAYKQNMFVALHVANSVKSNTATMRCMSRR